VSSLREGALGDRLWLILALSVVLRVALALVNREANDDHLAVVRFIADEGRFPGSSEAWESFQPKLYHVLVAGIWRVLDLQSATARILAGQLVSCAAGIVTVVVVLRFLRMQPLAPRVRALSFALVAWNPGLVAIGAQATNDALLILLGAVTLAAGHRFLRRAQTADAWTMTVAAAAATITKGNGLVLPLAVAATCTLPLLGRTPLGARGRTIVRRGAVVLGLSAATAFVLGPYRRIDAELGSPLTQPALANAPWPGLFARSVYGRPGVRSVAEAFFTFPLPDLVRTPILTIGDELREQSRTSFWALLYGRTHFSRYAACPPSWATRLPLVQWLGSALMIVALPPTLLLAFGFARWVVALVRTVLRRTITRHALADALLTVAACGYLTMAALYAAKLRDFSGVKEIFVAPAIVAFVAFFAGELARIDRSPRFRLIARAAFASGSLLAAGYVTDLVLLIVHLG
jgi:hypothetical protein